MSVDVVVCNLTRLGDLLQTQPLINDLHEAGYSVGLVCQENFASALPLLRNVSQSWTLPGARLLSDLDKAWPLALTELLEFSAEVARTKPSHVINLTPGLPARLLCKLLAPSASLLGFGIDEYGYGLNEGLWATFIAVAARQRANAPFNVSDMLRLLALPLTGKNAGDFLLAPPGEETQAWARSFLQARSENPKGFVAFQPGASSDIRRWPAAHFRALGQILWEKAGLVPVLLGAPNEAHLAEEYGSEAKHPWINAIGKTSLEQLAALLRECKLLVTNDTGTMHLAAGQDVPVMAFFLATAQPWDTAPLRPACCCLEPRMDCHPCSFKKRCQHHQCRSAISAESAADLILGWLESSSWAKGITDRVNRECRVWLTDRDADSLSELKLLSGGKRENRNLWLPRLRQFWQGLLNDIENITSLPDPKTEGQTLPPMPSEVAGNARKVLLQAASILDSLHECGLLLAKNPQASKLFLKNSERLQALLDTSPPLATLSAFWREFRNNQGNDLAKFLPAISHIGRHCRNFASSLMEPASVEAQPD